MTGSGETAEPRRIPALGGMRGLAVLCVIVAHTPPQDQGLGRFVHFGRLGVDLFFALSGYLITGILLGARDRIRDGRSSWRRAMRAFYARRALRILPAYFVTVLICLLVGTPRFATTWSGS